MIIGKIHQGSGLGDSLFSYIITRVIALDKGYDFGFVGKEFFKGISFMDLEWGENTESFKYHVEEPAGKVVLDHWPWATQKPLLFELNEPVFDPTFNFIPDGSIIDGYGAQDIKYFEHRLSEVKDWLKVEPLQIDRDCVVNVRGGEYRAVPDLILPDSYWGQAMSKMNKTTFQIHTDDIGYCRELFGKTADIVKDVSINWRSLRYAKNAIISNSAFAIIPRLLKHLEDPEAITIAPFGWNGRNASSTEWKGRYGNYYREFQYI